MLRRGLASVSSMLVAVMVIGACSGSSDSAASTASTTSGDLDTTRVTAVAAPSSAAPDVSEASTTSIETTEPTDTTDTTETTGDAAEPEGASTVPPDEVDALLADRPVDVVVPDGLDPDTPAPLVVVLHGYSGTGTLQDLYFGFRDEAARRGAILVHPDGTTDPRDFQFWNASDACCNFFGSDVDDVAYLTAVVDRVRSIHPVDPDRIFLAGHSNGGFMSYRLACERADLFAAIVSLAGAMTDDLTACDPTEPVSVVQVHGTADDVIRYDGGDILGNPYPSAAGSAGDWATLDGCNTAIEPAGTFDVDDAIAGDETTVARYTGCPDGVGVELWTIPAGSHLPDLGPGFAAAVFDFFEAHPDE